MTPRHPQGPHRLRPVHAWLLTALLLAAQALGLAHRVAHAPGLPASGALQAVSAGHADVPARGDASAGHESAGHEAGSADCRLIDQLAHADALCGGAIVPPALPRAAAIGAVADVPALPLGSAAAYLARGPPLSV